MFGRKSFVQLLVNIIFVPINGAKLEKRPYAVLDNPNGSYNPHLPGGASPQDVNSFPVLLEETTAAGPAAGATPTTASIPATPTLLATPVVSTAPSQTTAAPTLACAWTCNLFYHVRVALVQPDEMQI